MDHSRRAELEAGRTRPASDSLPTLFASTRSTLVQDAAREQERAMIFEPHVPKQHDFESCAIGRPDTS